MYLLISLFITAILILYINIYDKKQLLIINILLYISIITSIIYLINIWNLNKNYFNNMIFLNNKNIVLNIIMLFTLILLLPIITYYIKYNNYTHAKDIYPLLLFALLGGFLMTCFNNLIILFIGLELISINFYILIAINPYSYNNINESLKYFILSSIMTCFLLFGIAFIYGSTGSLNIDNIVIHNKMQMIGIIMIISVIMFKLALFPFYIWLPDIYYVTPSIVVLYMATIGKIAFMSSLIKLLSINHIMINNILINFICIPTLLIGNIMALYQSNIKKMLSYASIYHTGNMVIIILINNVNSFFILLLYLISYVSSLISVFGTLIVLKNIHKNYHIKCFNSLFYQNNFLGVITIISLISLSGLPITGGFFSKIFLLKTIIDKKYIFLVISIFISSIISITYYYRIIAKILEKNNNSIIISLDFMYKVTLLITTIIILILGVYPFIIYYIIS